jgi:hypothetical protein
VCPPITTKTTPMPRNGSATSSGQDSSPPETLTIEIFGTLSPLTLPAIHNAISSQASAAGVTPSDLPDGQMTDLFGRAHVPVSPSPQPERAKHQAMNATSGPNGSDLSAQFDRQSSLANRLKRRLDGVGSTLFTLTWKRKATPLGRPYYQLAASGRRISDNDFGSWQSPTAQNARHGSFSASEMERDPNVLHNQAYLASWPTPTLHDAERGGQEKRAMGETRHGSNLQDFALTTGPTLSGSPAQTESKGQLNPAFSLWLQGYPIAWLACAPSKMKQTRRS